MKVMDAEKRIGYVKEFLKDKGIKVKRIAVSDLGSEGTLVRVFTTLKSPRKARELELELLKQGIETEEFTVIINTQA